jgi:hypothetical protein
MKTDHPLIELRKLLLGYDTHDLLQAVSALQLIPENADCLIRLEALAHTVASLPAGKMGKPISHSKLRHLCNNEPLACNSIVSQEDPFDDMFTTAIPFHGGSYTVFPGIATASEFILSHLCRGLWWYQKPFSDKQFLGKAYDIIMVILLLSDEIARRAGLGRRVTPEPASRRKVTVPNANRMNCLKAAVCFERREIELMLRSRGVERHTLGEFVVEAGSVVIEDYRINEGSLLQHPIVVDRDRMVIVLPGMLLAVARHVLIKLARVHNVVDELVERYTVALWHTIGLSLQHLGNVPISIPEGNPLEIRHAKEGLFRFDTDKLAYILLVTDTLDNYDDTAVCGDWNCTDCGVQIVRRFRDVEDRVFKTHGHTNEMLFIVLIEGLGRSMTIGFSDDVDKLSSPFLCTSVKDFEVLSILESGDSLSLWKFANARQRVKAQTKCLAFSLLDEFSLYRKTHSFYLSDKRKPHFIYFTPGNSGELRRDCYLKRDHHVVTSYDNGRVTEVVALHDAATVPIYMPVDTKYGQNQQEFVLLVEAESLPIWVVCVFEDEAAQNLRRFYITFTDAIAYWLWQFTPSLGPVFKMMSSKYHHLTVKVRLIPNELWFGTEPVGGAMDNEGITISSDAHTGTINVTLEWQTSYIGEGPNNPGERKLMRRILEGCRCLLQDQGQRTLSDKSISTIVDTHAPLGQKKKILAVSVNTSPDLDERHLAPYREVQSADEEELLDDLGSHFQEVRKLTPQQLPDENRVESLNQSVAFFYGKFQDLVASLHPAGVLEHLVAYYDAILQQLAWHKLTMPTRLACFGSTPEILKSIQDDFAEINHVSMASRFVIEYVTASPPAGLRPMSLSVYDRLQALSSRIVNSGFFSDLVHFEVADLRVSMLPSGRLGIGREKYEEGHTAYLSTVIAAEIAYNTQTFDRYWAGESSAAANTPLRQRIERATLAEFGYSLTELLDFLTESYVISTEIEQPVAVLLCDEFLSRLAKRLNWEEGKVSCVFELFCLRPRANFLRPPEPFRKEDVYPWRFNRALSYLRKPFLIRVTSNHEEVAWARRHLYTATLYLCSLIHTARLRAASYEMKQLLGELNTERGERFNDAVADLFGATPGLIVRRRVKKFSRLRGSLAPPGDIDVLVADLGKRVVTVVETKDLARARTPFELANEAKHIFFGNENDKSIIQKQQIRLAWVQRHLAQVLASLGLASKGQWKVQAEIITDDELMSPYLRQSPIPIMSFEQLKASLTQR